MSRHDVPIHRGFKPKNAKLDAAKAVEIYRAKGKLTSRELAKRYGVDPRTITSVWSGRSFNDATLELRQQELHGGEGAIVETESIKVAERLIWHDPKWCEPDDGIDVLVRTPSPSMPVWIGHIDSGRWYYCDGAEIAYEVLAWADLPTGELSP